MLQSKTETVALLFRVYSSRVIRGHARGNTKTLRNIIIYAGNKSS